MMYYATPGAYTNGILFMFAYITYVYCKMIRMLYRNHAYLIPAISRVTKGCSGSIAGPAKDGQSFDM